ncbi:MAG: hypothetical protein KY475_13125 [Planctomycetes bacterium]|nr:hypothetical protein [Planctomycetota bacterium]
MPSNIPFRLLLATALVAAGYASAAGRTWTNHQGKQIEAEYVRLDGQNVVLLMNGREFSVPLIQLSADDKRYVFQRVAGVPAEDAPKQPAASESAKPAAAAKASSDEDESDAASRRRGAAEGVARIREWSDDQGNTVRAKYIRIHEDNVMLMQGRKVVPCPIAKLSAEDQDYLRTLLEARGEGHLMPSPEQLASRRGGGEYGGGESEYGEAMPGVASAPYSSDVAETPAYSPPAYSAPSYASSSYSPPAADPMPSGHDAGSYAYDSGGAGSGYTPPGGSPSYSAGGGSSGYGSSGGAGSSGHDADSMAAAGMPSYSGSGYDGSSDTVSSYGGGPPSGPRYGMGPEVASATTPPSVPTLEWVHECSQCGKQVSEEDTSCPHCGVRFINATGGGSSSSVASNSNDDDSGRSYRVRGRGLGKLIGLAITGIFVVIGALARVFGFGSSR